MTNIKRRLALLGVGLLMGAATILGPASSASADATYPETVGGNAHTWTNPANAGGSEGALIGAYSTVQIACKLQGFAVQDGNTWWYRIASSPWNYAYYVSADAFYNNGATSGSLLGTPWFDPAVPDCGSSSETTETTGGVANTWTDYRSAGGTAGPQIGRNVTVQIACRLEGFAVQDGNSWWYRIASAPWNSGFYVSADAFYNNGATSGSLLGTPWVDQSVPECSGSTGGSPSSPTVTLAQGQAASSGYRYAISLNAFPANSRVALNCYDSASPNGFYPFSLTTDSGGNASTQAYCFSGDGPDHWVVASGRFESNHVSWSASGSGGGGSGGGGATGGGSVPAPTPQPSCAPPTSANPSTDYAFDVRPKQPRTDVRKAEDQVIKTAAQGGTLVGGPVSYKLADHYISATGKDVSISLNDLMLAQPPLRASYNHYLQANASAAVSKLRATPAGQCSMVSLNSGWIGYKITDIGDWYLACRSFDYYLAGSAFIGRADTAGRRTLTFVYRAHFADTYNFNPGDKLFGRFEQLAIDGWAADFKVRGKSATFKRIVRLDKFNPKSLRVEVS